MPNSVLYRSRSVAWSSYSATALPQSPHPQDQRPQASVCAIQHWGQNFLIYFLATAIVYIQVKVINFDLYRKVHEEVMKQLDRMENDFLPQVTLNIVEVKSKVIFLALTFIWH